MTKFRSRKMAALWLSASASSVLLAASAHAQTTASTPAAKDDESIVLQQFVVTGSNIPSAGEIPANPVSVYTPIEIERAGVSNDLLQVLRKTAPQFSGNGNIGSENGNIASGATNGGSQLSLRNSATLVLVNGRRITAAPVAATGGGVFVDVNAIPVSAVARIEVLTDGSSAIYGSDAVGGVVNIILKSDYKGSEVGVRYGSTDNPGHYTQKTAYGITGGQIGEHGPSITASFEWTRTDPLFNFERPFATPAYGTTSFPGVIQLGSFSSTGAFSGQGSGYYYLDPKLTKPNAAPGTLQARGYTVGPVGPGVITDFFDLSRYVTMILGNEKKIGTVTFEQKFSDGLTLFGDLMYSKTNTESQLNAQPVRVAVHATDPFNTLGLDLRVGNRFIDHPREYIADTKTFRIVTGLKGNINEDWSWESALNYSRGVQDFSNANLVRTEARLAAVNAGKIDLFSRVQPAGALDGVFGAASGRYVSTLASWDGKVVDTNLFTLPGGKVALAVGGEYRKEKLSATSDPDSQSATFAYDDGTTIDPFNQKRTITSVFAEAQVPIIGESNRVAGVYDLRLILAGRHERYSDTDDPTVPKYTLTYSPIADLKFRATYSESFAAPTLYDLNSPTNVGFTNPLAAFDGTQANQQTLAVTTLSPSKAKSYGYGVVYTPKAVKDFSVSLDFYNITQDDLVSNLGATGVVDQVFADVDAKGSASQFAKYMHTSSFTGPTITTPGQITALGLDNIYYSIPASSNIGTQKISGFDLKFDYVFTLTKGNKLIFDSSSTYYSKYDIQPVAGADFTHTAGRVTALNGTIPRWRTYNTLTWEFNQLGLTIGHTYYPSTRDSTWTQEDFGTSYPTRTGKYSVFDLNLAYTLRGDSRWFRGLKVDLGVTNLNNKLPPRSATYDGLSNADIGEFSPVGRLYYGQVAYKF